MIVVIMGGTESKRDAVIKDLVSLYPGRVQSLNLDHIQMPHQRLERLMMEFDRPFPFRSIRVVNNPSSKIEVNWLREKGAFFAHMYGALSVIYDHITVMNQDVMIAPIPHRKVYPSHVLTPEEAISDFMLRGRKVKAA
ncbi:hypothetical protein [Vibrio fluvialis]|uniref:hypothetical protein n=1 Tax=Vibrio fluvialis TaxID=676 RepID=UPI00399B026B